MATNSAAIDQFDKSMKKQIASILRALVYVKSVKEDNTPCKIDEGLFLGSVGAASNKAALKNLNITHVLTVAGKLAPAHPRDFVYKIIDVADRDDTNLKQYFNACFDFIDEAKRNGGFVLVHCYAGRSRSVTIVVAYLMKTRGMSLSEALQHVQSKRPQAAPNSGFIRQLEDFEKSLQAPWTLLDLGLNDLGPKTLAVVCGRGTCKDTPAYQRYGILLFLYLRPWSPQGTAYQRYASFVQQDDPIVSSRVGPCPCTRGAGARVLLCLLMSGVGTK